MRHYRGRASLLAALFLACGEGGTTGSPTEPPTPVATSASITPPSVTLAALGEMVPLSAAILDQNGQPMRGVNVVWASSDGSVATVDAAGVVTAVWNGSTTVTAAVPGGVSASAGVTVAQQPRDVRVSPDQERFTALGDTLRLSGQAFDANGHAIDRLDFRWLSNNESVVTVDASGLVTAVDNGSAIITVASGPASGRAGFTVAQEAVALQLSPAANTLRALGATLRMRVSGIDANGHPVNDAPEGLTWSSDNESVATVDASGLVTAVGKGSASITVSGNNVMSSATVTVEQEAAVIRMSARGDTLQAFADTLRLSAEAFDANGHAVEGAELRWSSGDEAVVAVDGMGLVAAVGNGSTTVTASTGLTSAGVSVTVAQQASTVRVSPFSGTLRWVGDTLRISADGFDANRFSVEGAAFTWSSSDESVATVDADGLATGQGAGTVNITATVADGDISGTAIIQVNSLPDRDALIALYNATDGPNWANNENWLTGAPISQWYGVSTDPRGEVTGLDLRKNGLAGEIPRQVADFVDLQTLILSQNALTGPIPPELGNLTDLRRLSLSGNELSGTIPPQLGALSNLRDLFLGYNRLSGSIPLELANLTWVTRFRLTSNDLTGSIPPELGNLRLITDLMLGGNRFTGSIPSELGNLIDVRQLWLGDNELTGQIPPELGALSKLESLLLHDNFLTGSIPPELASLTELGQLYLRGNNLTGALPAWLGTLSNLEDLLLDNNDFTGSIPPELSSLTKLRQLWLASNDLEGPLPQEFANLASLEELLISNNPLSGRLPQGLIAIPLEQFSWHTTDLCAPANDAFQAWLRSIERHYGGATCAP